MILLLELAFAISVLSFVSWLYQQHRKKTKKVAEAERATSAVMELEEAKGVVLRHASELIEKGHSFDRAVLFVLSNEYLPGITEPALETEMSGQYQRSKQHA